MKDWNRTLRESIEILKTKYNIIGRKTGAPFLAITYPVEVEGKVLHEWQVLSQSLGSEFVIHQIDILSLTMTVLDDIGLEEQINTLQNPPHGGNPEQELGLLWISELNDKISEAFEGTEPGKKPIVLLYNLAALYPAAGPQDVMQRLWDDDQDMLKGPVVLLIPGTLTESRRYQFLDLVEEYMYRGEIF